LQGVSVDVVDARRCYYQSYYCEHIAGPESGTPRGARWISRCWSYVMQYNEILFCIDTIMICRGRESRGCLPGYLVPPEFRIEAHDSGWWRLAIVSGNSIYTLRRQIFTPIIHDAKGFFSFLFGHYFTCYKIDIETFRVSVLYLYYILDSLPTYTICYEIK